MTSWARWNTSWEVLIVSSPNDSFMIILYDKLCEIIGTFQRDWERGQ